MRFTADFHIHSKYSRATSKAMEIPQLAKWARIKGIDLLGTGDFTHHLWLQELKKYLEPKGESGLYLYNDIQSSQRNVAVSKQEDIVKLSAYNLDQ